MRNFTLLQLFFCCLLILIGSNLYSQIVVINSTSGNAINNRHQEENHYKNLYKEVAKDARTIVYVKNDINSVLKNQSNGISIKLSLVYDAQLYSVSPSGIMIVNEQTGYTQVINQISGSSIELMLPEKGSYDFIARFDRVDGGNSASWIIKELESVVEGTIVEIDAAEATHLIKKDIVNQSGELLRPGVWDDFLGDYVGGNSQVFVGQVLYFKPLEISLNESNYSWTGRYSENEEPSWNFYINTISDRYYLMASLMGVGYDAENYIIKAPLLKGVSDSHELMNNPSDYTFHTEKFKTSIAGSNNPYVYPAFTSISTLNGKQINNSQFWTAVNSYSPTEQGVQFYLDNSVRTDDPYHILISAGIVDKFQYINPFATIPAFMKGNPIILKENNEIMYGSGYSGHSLYFFGQPLTPPEGIDGLYPFHPKFSYSTANASNRLQGDNVPINRTYFYNGQLKIQYKGRFGEVRESDLFGTDFNVQQSGNSVYNGDILGFSQTQLPTSGEVSITLKNNNIESIDGLISKNSTTFTYDASNNDAPPTVQMLQFRNINGEVNDRFLNPADGQIRLAAGDFQYNNMTTNIDYKAGNQVEFYYSLYDQNNWTPLALMKQPEHFSKIAFGDYYEGSLEKVTVPEKNSWFDVKIVCTDAAGNKQEQLISPAFQIQNQTLEVTENRKSSFNVYPNPFIDHVNISLPTNIKGDYIFKVIDLSGKVIYSEKRNVKSGKIFTWDSASVTKGIYILSLEQNEGTVNKKVIKK